MIQSIHHIELNVSDLERSFRFYEELASFFEGSSVEREAASFLWNVGQFYFYFNQVEPRFADISYHRKRVGLDHIAIKLSSKDEVLLLREFLKNRCIECLYDADYYGPKYFALYFEDPDRFKLEFGADTD